MIGKISKGAGFRGCVNYVLGKPDAKLLAAEGVLTDSIQTITDCFQSQRMMKPHIRQPVGHISLSYAPEDASRMTDEILVSLAKEYMQKMGIKETQYIIARHKDQKHPHVHIVFNRVDNNRRTISDKNDCYRNVKVCKELKEKYGLYFGKGKDRVRTHRLKGNDKTKYEIYHAVKYSLSKSNNWKLFISELSRQGIKTEFKYRGKSNVIQGLSLTKDGITFKASGIDRNFSYSKLDKQLGENNNQYQQGIGMTTNNGQPVIQHENTYTSSSNIAESLVGALGGLFTPTFNNADDTVNNIGSKEDMTYCDYPISVSGQKQAISDIFNAVASVNSIEKTKGYGLGGFYWEPSWIGTSKRISDSCGTGWSSSVSENYENLFVLNGSQYATSAQGSSWDNMTLFDKNGVALQSLQIFNDFKK